ncbi:MAG: acyl-CoA dehydrogenase family protein [Planctomycetota bacterium]
MIESPDSGELTTLCEQLAGKAGATDAAGKWPEEQLRLCGEAGVYRWFLPRDVDGLAWDDADVVRGYLALSAACLTTTFVITQRTSACRRFAGSDNTALKGRLLRPLSTGKAYATVGISHLTTSGRHLARPRVEAVRVDGGWQLSGVVPWVTGADHAQHILLGATIVEDGEPTTNEVLLALPTSAEGVEVPPPFQLIGVSASHTGMVNLKNAFVEDGMLVAGPCEQVLAASGRGISAGGHETSTLALGLASAAIDYLQSEAANRPDLDEAATRFGAEHAELVDELLAIARGEPACSTQELRTRANSLVLRATQATLSAAKGAGYVAGHPAGRWCREALFFMVWSCPQPVMAANLCELAGIE